MSPGVQVQGLGLWASGFRPQVWLGLSLFRVEDFWASGVRGSGLWGKGFGFWAEGSSVLGLGFRGLRCSGGRGDFELAGCQVGGLGRSLWRLGVKSCEALAGEPLDP